MPSAGSSNPADRRGPWAGTADAPRTGRVGNRGTFEGVVKVVISGMLALALGAWGLVACQMRDMQVASEKLPYPTSSPKRPDKVVKSDEEWQRILTPEQYRILRRKGTEAAFCSPLLDNKKKGVYVCAGCGLELFRTDEKFESGTGWPSFFRPASDDAIWLARDTSYGMIRTEVLCSRCDGHLGHVFPDGPPPTGLRFCINGEALKFVER